MRCVRCHRPINAAAAIVPSAGQPFRYGPKCARLAGLIEPRTRALRVRLFSATQAAPDPKQLVLELTR
jgi:hypothetical protein